MPPGAVSKCGGDRVFQKERAEIRTGTIRADQAYRFVFNMQARTTDPNIDSWLSAFQIKCTGNGPPPYMLLLGSETYPDTLPVRYKSSWGSTAYLPLFNASGWQDAKRLRVTVTFDLRCYTNTTVEGRHGEVASVATTGRGWCVGSPYLKFGLYREYESIGGTARLGIGNIAFMRSLRTECVNILHYFYFASLSIYKRSPVYIYPPRVGTQWRKPQL